MIIEEVEEEEEEKQAHKSTDLASQSLNLHTESVIKLSLVVDEECPETPRGII